MSRPIYFISLTDLLSCASFPRNPEEVHLTVPLEDVNVAESFIVFISHCWLRGYAAAEGYNGRPHPDNPRHEKLALCKKGIKKLKDELAPECKYCYVWLDFACINQDGNPCGELKQLDRIVGVCDCVFTPIVEDAEDISLSKHRVGTIEGDPESDKPSDEFAKNYKSKKWDGDEHSYLNRGWTRVEMFYASAVPLWGHDDDDLNAQIQAKRENFRAGLHLAASQSRRPQFVYGTYQMENRLPVRVLPPLLHSYFHRYNPINGHLSVVSDREKITELVYELAPYLLFAEDDYVGSYNGAKQKHGHGKCTYKNGDVYEGEFFEDQKHGNGLYLYSDGCRYQGTWSNNKEDGYGVFTYACGDVYEGETKGGKFHGAGKITSVTGKVLRGFWREDKYIGAEIGDPETVCFPPAAKFERELSCSLQDPLGEPDAVHFDDAYSCSSGDGRDFDCDLSVSPDL